MPAATAPRIDAPVVAAFRAASVEGGVTPWSMNDTSTALTRMLIDAEGGTPDGMRCDVDGNLWCGWGMGSEALDGVLVFAPDGAKIGRIALPARGEMEADIATWRERQEGLGGPADDIDFQTDYVRDLLEGLDYPAFDLDLVREHAGVEVHPSMPVEELRAICDRLDVEYERSYGAGKLILDDSDAYGVEMALQLAEAAGGGEVVLISMAPNGEVSGLRTALAMGAARAVLVSDAALSGSDALSTAKVLAKAVERAGDVDLLLTATESTDGYTGTIPAQVAELLGWPSLTFAKHVEVGDGKVTIQRQTEAGYDVVEATLPAVVSVTAGVVEPRYPSFKGIMAAKNKPVDQVTVTDLGLTADDVGWSGARQQIVSVGAAPERQAGEKIEDDGEAYTRVVEFLETLKVI